MEPFPNDLTCPSTLITNPIMDTDVPKLAGGLIDSYAAATLRTLASSEEVQALLR